MRAIGVALDVAPQLPPHAEADALPRAEDAIVLNKVDLEANQLTVSLKEPPAQTADA